MSQPDTCSIKRREVNSGNDCQEPQSICQATSMSPSNNQKSCYTQVTTTTPPRSKKPEWDALITYQSARHPWQCRLKPDLGELSVSLHTWRTKLHKHWEQETDTENKDMTGNNFSYFCFLKFQLSLDLSLSLFLFCHLMWLIWFIYSSLILGEKGCYEM